MCKRYYFCECAGECISINSGQNFQLKTLVTLVFKLGPQTLNVINLILETFRLNFKTLCQLDLGLDLESIHPVN